MACMLLSSIILTMSQILQSRQTPQAISHLKSFRSQSYGLDTNQSIRAPLNMFSLSPSDNVNHAVSS